MNACLFQNVAIVGPGLIGGSLGLALHGKQLAGRVIGVGRRKESLDTAVQMGAVDVGTMDLGAAVADADLVVLATGIGKILEQMQDVIANMKSGALLTDVGSVKGIICKTAEKLLAESKSGVRFVGGHPLAGSEQRGVGAAREDLFCGAVCVLTPTPATDPGGVGLSALRTLWRQVGCRICEYEPSAHDFLVALSSHLPHVAAATLVNVVSDEALNLAASGFRDTTRVASGAPSIWLDICETNREAIVSALRKYAKEINSVAAALEEGDMSTIHDFLSRAKTRRDAKWG